MYEEELLYLRSRGMAPPGTLGIHPYLGGGLPANLTDHLERYRLGFHGKSPRCATPSEKGYRRYAIACFTSVHDTIKEMPLANRCNLVVTVSQEKVL